MKGMKASDHLVYYMIAYGMRITLGAIIIAFIVMIAIMSSRDEAWVTGFGALIGLIFVVVLAFIEYHLRNYRRKWLESQQSTAKSE
jgi:uncharacterized membrane protein YgaE (UPF0421/DUF939 family)